MRVNTRVIIDIGTDTVLHRESYEYTGPLALCTAVNTAAVSSNGAIFAYIRMTGAVGAELSDVLNRTWGAELPNFLFDWDSLAEGGWTGRTRLDDNTALGIYVASWTWRDPDFNFPQEQYVLERHQTRAVRQTWGFR